MKDIIQCRLKEMEQENPSLNRHKQSLIKYIAGRFDLSKKRLIEKVEQKENRGLGFLSNFSSKETIYEREEKFKNYILEYSNKFYNYVKLQEKGVDSKEELINILENGNKRRETREEEDRQYCLNKLKYYKKQLAIEKTLDWFFSERCYNLYKEEIKHYERELSKWDHYNTNFEAFKDKIKKEGGDEYLIDITKEWIMLKKRRGCYGYNGNLEGKLKTY